MHTYNTCCQITFLTASHGYCTQQEILLGILRVVELNEGHPVMLYCGSYCIHNSCFSSCTLSQNTNSSYAWKTLWCINYAPNMHIAKKKNILAPFQSLSHNRKKGCDVCFSRDSQIQNYQTYIGLSLTFHDFESLVFVLILSVCI